MLEIIAHAVAPVSPMMFKWVDFKLFGLKFNQYNFVGVFLMFTTMIYLTMAYFMLSDLTKEKGYQIFLIEEELGENHTSTGANHEHQKLLSIKNILTTFDIMLILTTILILNYIYTQAELVINIIAVDKFQWTVEHLGIFSISTIIIALSVMHVLKRLHSGVDIYYIIVCFVTGNGLSMAILAFLSNYEIRNAVFQSFLVLSIMSLNIIAGYSASIFTTFAIALVVPVHSRCFVVGLRQVSMKLALCLGYFSTTLLYNVSIISYPIMSLCCFALSFIYLCNSFRFIRKYCRRL